MSSKKKKVVEPTEPIIPPEMDVVMEAALITAAANPTIYLESIQRLQQEWPLHGRYQEFIARFIRQALNQGELIIVKTILTLVPEIDLIDPRLRTEADEAELAARIAAAAPPVDPNAPPAADASSRPSTGEPAGSPSRNRSRERSSLGNEVKSPKSNSNKSPVAGSRRTTSKKNAKAADEPPPPPPPPPPRYSRDQLLWLSEIELLRALVKTIDLESLYASEKEANPGRDDEPSVHSSLGWEFDVSRASKLRPSCMGVHVQLTSRQPAAGQIDSSPIVAPVSSLKFPSLSPRLGAMGSARGKLGSPSPRVGSLSPRSKRRSSGADEIAPVIPEVKQDPMLLEFERWRYLGRAIWFASRGQHWLQFLALVTRYTMNFLQGAGTHGKKYTPSDWALKLYQATPAILKLQEKEALLRKEKEVADKAAAEQAENTGRKKSSSSSTTVAAPIEPSPTPAPVIFYNFESDKDRDSNQFSTPLTVLSLISNKLFGFLDSLRKGETAFGATDAASQEKQLQLLQLFTDIPAIQIALAPSFTLTPPYWFLKYPSLPILPVVRTINFIIQTFFHSLRWKDVLDMGRSLLQSLEPFAYEPMKFFIYAQEELRHRAKSDWEQVKQQLADLKQSYEHDAQIIRERRDSKRSQRGKREEEERLGLLTGIYDQQRLPLEAIEVERNRDFAFQDVELNQLRDLAARLLANEPKYLRPLINARFKLLSYYNDSVRNQHARFGGSLEDLAAVSESRAASRPVSRGGSVLDSENDTLTQTAPTENDDLKSMISASVIGSTTMTPSVAAAYQQTKKQRKMREKHIQAVITAYQKVIKELRAEPRRESRPILGRVLLELGDFIYVEYGAPAPVSKLEKANQLVDKRVHGHGKREDAFVPWHECLDAVFMTLESIKQREVILGPYLTPSGELTSPKNNLSKKLGFWNVVNGLLACAKIARLQYFNHINLRMEAVRYGVSLARSLFHYAPTGTHPAMDVTFGRYQCESLLPGCTDLFSDPTRVKMGQLFESLEFLGKNILKYHNEPVLALPLFTLYEYLARKVACNIFHTTNARILKVQACLAAGLMTEASELYITIVEGLDLPFANVTGLPLRAHPASMPPAPAPVVVVEKKKRKENKDGASSPRSSSKDTTDQPITEEKVNIPPFHSYYPPMHSTNRPFILYLLGDLRPQSHLNTSPQAQLYGGYLWSELRFLRAEFITRIASPRQQLASGLEEVDEGAAAYDPKLAPPTKEKKRPSSRPSSRENSRPRSAPKGVEANTPATTGLTAAEIFALRTHWLRAAERIYTETIALFVPNDPNAKAEDAAPAPVITSPVKKARKDDPPVVPVNRRRTAQNFTELFNRQLQAAVQAAAGTSKRSSLPQGVTLNSDQPPTAFEQANSNVNNLELLTALTKNHAILPVALVAHSYDRLSQLRLLQGLNSDAVYFAKRALRIMSENNGTELPQQPSIGTMSRDASPSTSLGGSPIPTTRSMRPLSPSLTSRNSGRSPRRPEPIGREGSLAGLMKDRTDKFVREFSANPALISSVPSPTGPSIGPYGLLTVPAAPGAQPLSWRQLIDPRDWIATRLRLASILIQQGRLAKASEQLGVAESEAKKIDDPASLHSCATIHARMLLQEGKFLQGFTKLRSIIWREKTFEEQEKYALMLSKVPGGAKALPPLPPNTNTYSLDHGETLLLMLQLLRRLPKKDHPDMKSAKGDVHTGWILQLLEQVSLDRMEQYGIKPTDLALAATTLVTPELLKLTANSDAIPYSERTGRNVIDLNLPGVVSLYSPWISSAIHAHFLTAKDLLYVRNNPTESMKRALVCQQLLSFVTYPPPILKGEIDYLLAVVGWRKIYDGWVHSGVNLEVGCSPDDAIPPLVPVQEEIPPPAPSTPTNKKKGPTARTVSPSTQLARNSPSPSGDKKSSASSKKKKNSSKAQAEMDAIAAALAAAQLAEQAASIAKMKEDLSNRLYQPMKSNEPRSLPAIFLLGHEAIKYAVLHGMQHMRIKKFASLLVEIHSECARLASAMRPSSTATLLLSSDFHLYLAAFWNIQAARAVEGFNFLQARALTELSAQPLPTVAVAAPTATNARPTSSSGRNSTQPETIAPNVPAYILTELGEAFRLREKRKREELTFLTSSQNDPNSIKLREEMKLESVIGSTGKGSRKDKEKDSSETATPVKKDRRGAPPPPEPDQAISTRSLLLYANGLRAELSARRFESELAAAFLPEQAALLDVHEVLKQVSGYEQSTIPWTGLITELGTMDKLFSSAPAVKTLIDETEIVSGTIIGVWMKRILDASAVPLTDAAAASEPLTLSLTLSTELHRGLQPLQPLASARGKKKSITASKSSTSPSSSRKKKNQPALEEVERPRTAAQLLFGDKVGRFEPIQLHITKENVTKLAASAASLRHTITNRVGILTTPPSGSPIDLAPSEKLSFIELLLQIQSAFVSRRQLQIPGLDSHASTEPSLLNLTNYIEYFTNEYGLAPSLSEVQVFESLFDCSSEHGGATVQHSNGVCFFLHQFSTESVQRLNDATIAAQLAAAAAPPPVVSPVKSSHKKESTRARTPNSSNRPTSSQGDNSTFHLSQT